MNTTLRKHVTGKINKRAQNLSVPQKHQLAIAQRTMKMHCAGCMIMGGNHRDAANTIHNLTGAIVGINADCACRSSEG